MIHFINNLKDQKAARLFKIVKIVNCLMIL